MRRLSGALAILLAIAEAAIAGGASWPQAPRDARHGAIEAFRQMRLERAEQLALEWLRSHPRDEEIARLLGMVRVSAGMELERQGSPRPEYLAVYDGALEALLRAEGLAAGRPQPDLNHAVGYVLGVQGRCEEAIERLSRAIEETPDNFVLYRLRGSCRLDLGAVVEAESDLRRAIALNGSDFASWIFLAQTLSRRGRSQDARAELERYYARIESEPDDERHFRLLYEIAGYALQHDDAQGGRAPLERACRIQPRNAVCRNELGKLYHRLGLADEALRELEAVLSLPSVSKDLRTEALHYRGLIGYDQEDYATAAGYLERALKLSPNRADTLKNYGSTLRKLGQRERAREVLERFRDVVELENEVARLRAHLVSDPRHRGARVDLIRSLIRLERGDDARQELEELKRDHPRDEAISGLEARLERADLQ